MIKINDKSPVGRLNASLRERFQPQQCPQYEEVVHHVSKSTDTVWIIELEPHQDEETKANLREKYGFRKYQ